MNADSGLRTVLITGATSVIGYQLGLCFAKEGYSLILVAGDELKLKDTAADFSNRLGSQVTIVSIDLSLLNAGNDLYGKVKDLLIDAVVNADMDTHAESLKEFTRLVLPQFVERGYGKVFNVTHDLIFSEKLAEEIRGKGIVVTTLYASQNNSNPVKLGTIDEGAVARAGYKGFIKNKSLIVSGFKNKLRVLLSKFIVEKSALAAEQPFNKIETK